MTNGNFRVDLSGLYCGVCEVVFVLWAPNVALEATLVMGTPGAMPMSDAGLSFSLKIDDENFLRPDLGDILRDALIKSRIFGAAFIYIGADDGHPQETPLSIAEVKSVRFLNVLTIKGSHQKTEKITR